MTSTTSNLVCVLLAAGLVHCGGNSNDEPHGAGTGGTSTGGASAGGASAGGASAGGTAGATGGAAGVGGSSISIPTHAPSWAYVGKYGFVPEPAIVQQYLDYAEGGIDANDSCPPDQDECAPVFYVDAGKIYIPDLCPGDDTPFMSSPDFEESWLLHDAAPIGPDTRIGKNQIYKSTPECGDTHIFRPNQQHLGVQAYYLDRLTKKLPPNGLFMEDDFPRTLSGLLGGSGASSTVEYPDTQSMLEGFGVFLDAMLPHQGFTNSLAGGGYFPSTTTGGNVDLANNVEKGNYLGMIAEKPMFNRGASGNFVFTVMNARIMLNDGANINQHPGLKHVILDFISTVPAEAEDAQHGRRVHTALIWLVFEPGRTVNWEQAAPTDATTFGFFAEQLIYPTLPLSTMGPFVPGAGNGSGCPDTTSDQGGARDLRVTCGTDGNGAHPAGVYVREFESCAYEGTPFGPCAAILNTTNQDFAVEASWLQQTYAHTIEMQGGPYEKVGCPTCDGSIDLDSSAFAIGDVVTNNDALLLVP